MKNFLTKALFISGLFFVDGQSSEWSESFKSALQGNEISVARSLVLDQPIGCGLVEGYSELGEFLVNHPELEKRVERFSKEFQFSLKRGVSNSCFQDYRASVQNSSLPTSVRLSILQAMIDGDSKLSSANKIALANMMKSVLLDASDGPKLKSQILLRISRYTIGSDNRHFLRFINDEDSLLRQSAYLGLAGRIRANRHQGNSGANRTIFDAIVSEDSSIGSLGRVKIIATIGEDYARDYLLGRCAGSPTKLAAIFHQDHNLTHMGIIREALRLLSQSPSNLPLQKAIQFGTRNPMAVINTLLMGSNEDRERGLLLLGLFPKLASLSGSGNPSGTEGATTGGKAGVQ